MGWSGFHFAFELGDAVAKEHRQFGCGEIIPVAARALLYQLEGETKIRGKFAGRLWTHSTDPDCEMRETAKTLSARKHHCLENLGYCFLSLPSEGCSRACQSDAHGPYPKAQSMTDEGAKLSWKRTGVQREFLLQLFVIGRLVLGLLEGCSGREFASALHGRFELRDATEQNAFDLRHIGAIDHVSTLVEVLETFAKLGERIGRDPAVAHKLLSD